MPSTPTVEMLWEPIDPHEALARRFGFADPGQLAAWVTEALTDTWAVEVISCDRVLISAGNALVWITSSTGRMIFKWSVRPSLFARLANIARLTSWLQGRGIPVSAPLPASNGDLQVELSGFSIGLQSAVEGSMLDADNLAQVHAAGAELARLHLALAEYPDTGPLGPGGQAESTPLRTRVEGWLHTTAGHHVAPLAESLRRRLASLPSETTLPPLQLVISTSLGQPALRWRSGQRDPRLRGGGHRPSRRRPRQGRRAARDAIQAMGTRSLRNSCRLRRRIPGGPSPVSCRSGVARATHSVANPATGPGARRSDRLGGIRRTDVGRCNARVSISLFTRNDGRQFLRTRYSIRPRSGIDSFR